MCVIDLTTIPDPMGGGLLVGASAAFHAALWKKNEWEKVVKLLQLYSDEPPPPAGVNCYLHRKLLFTIAMSRLHLYHRDEPPPPTGVNCYLHRKLLFTIAMSRLHLQV